MNKNIAGNILLVGEGDFSLTRSLTKVLDGPSSRIIATSFDDDNKITKHSQVEDNLNFIKSQGVQIFHGVDATALENHDVISKVKFSRIIFNFPHVGGKSNIRKNKELLKNFCLSAVKLLLPDGEICISLCNGQGGTPADKPVREWFNSWQVVGMAAYASLILRDAVPFKAEDFFDYNSVGYRSLDKGFRTNNATTYIFVRSLSNTCHRTIQSTVTIDGQKYICQEYVSERIKRLTVLPEDHPFVALKKEFLKNCSEEFENVEDISKTISPLIWDDSNSKSRYLMIPESKVPPNCDHPEKSELRTENLHSQCTLLDVCSECYKKTTSQPLFYRESLKDNLQNLSNNCQNSDIKILAGQSFLRGSLASDGFPEKYELLGLSKNSDNLHHRVLSILAETMEKVSKINCVFSAVPQKDCDISYDILAECDCQDYIMPGPFTGRFTYQEVVDDFKSLPNGALKVGEIRRFKESESKEEFVYFLLDLVVLAQLAYQVADSRLLWSADERIFTSPQIKNFSIYPLVNKFEQCFWENKDIEFDEIMFSDILRNVADDNLVHIELWNTFHHSEYGVSKNYRETFWSCDKSLSYHLAHDMQTYMRLQCEKYMKVTLR